MEVFKRKATKEMIKEVENRELLLKDLCARLAYGVYVKDINKGIKVCKIHEMKPSNAYHLTLIPMSDSYYQVYSCDIDSVKPYLRSMSSMTEEEKKEYQSLCEIHFERDADDNVTYYYFDSIESIDYLNKKMFDYRGLIDEDLAIEVTKDNNPYK